MSSRTGHASLIGATFGPYQVQALVGRGAMGTVYLARDTVLKRQVALKVLLGHLARNPLLVRRFHREAQATAKLRHPNIVRIYAAGVEAGTPYIAMEYVEGEPLDRFLRRYGRLEWQRALHIGAQVAEALVAAHAEGITHRDVKPANIMLDMQGRVRLTDFGIAHVHTELEENAPEESFVGTPRYMSPEQCANRDITASTDLFSLGIVLYEMIAGVQPFQGESAVALIKRITNDDPPRLNKLFPEVPDDVARLVAHLLEKRPTDRPARAADVVRRIAALQAENGGRSALPDALTAFIRDQAQPRMLPDATPAHGRDATPAEKAPAPRRRRQRALITAAVLVCAAALPHVWRAAAPTGVVAQAYPDLNAAIHTDQGVLRTQLPMADYEVSALAWSDDEAYVLVWMHGRPGTLAHGNQGLLRVHADTGMVESIAAPAQYASSFIPVPLDHAGERTYFIDAASNRRNVIAYASANAEPVAMWSMQHAAEAVPWSSRRPVWAIHPGETRLCTQDGMTLTEYPLLADGTTQRRVIADSVVEVTAIRYAPTGDALAYIERLGPQDEWLTLTGGPFAAPERVAPVRSGSDVSFSPDSRYLAYTKPDGSLEAFDLHANQIVNLGAGTVSPRAWHPSGAYLVALSEHAGQQRLAVIHLSGPRKARTLDTPVPVATPPVLSPDGARLTAIVRSGDGVEVMVMDLENGAGRRTVAQR